MLSGENSSYVKPPMFTSESRQAASTVSRIIRLKVSGATGSGKTSPTFARVQSGYRSLGSEPTIQGSIVAPPAYLYAHGCSDDHVLLIGGVYGADYGTAQSGEAILRH